MNCFICKGDMEESTNTYMTDLGHCVVVVKNVPCTRCKQCGEVWYSGVVSQKLEELIDQLETNLTEIAVMTYPSDRVA